jgi:hypothetical protein
MVSLLKIISNPHLKVPMVRNAINNLPIIIKYQGSFEILKSKKITSTKKMQKKDPPTPKKINAAIIPTRISVTKKEFW